MSDSQKRKAKPWIVVLTILALIAVSMLGITLSSYIKELQLFGSGWVGPKHFAFSIDKSGDTKNLAPGESVEYTFSVRNHDNDGVSQIPLHVSIEIAYPPQLAGTGIIQADLYREGTLLASDVGGGALAASGSTLPANTATTDHYALTLTWLDSDVEYLGEIQSKEQEPSIISISVSGYQ